MKDRGEMLHFKESFDIFGCDGAVNLDSGATLISDHPLLLFKRD